MKSVLDPIPRTQHRPICVTVNPVIVPQPTASRRRFNLKKANWDGFSTEFDAAIEEVNSAPNDTANCVKPSRSQQRGPDLPFLDKPAMRTRWMVCAAPYKSG